MLCCQVGQIRHHARGRHVAPGFAGGDDGAAGAAQGHGEVVVFVVARFAAADIEAPAGRRIEQPEPLGAPERDQRIPAAAIEPVRALIVNDAEFSGAAPHPAADAAGCFQERVAAAGGGDAAGGRNSGSTGADNGDLDFARGRQGAKRRRCRERCRSGQKLASGDLPPH